MSKNKLDIASFLKSLTWAYGLRSFLCMLPMLIAFFLGYEHLAIPLGQGGFLYSMLPVSKTTGERLLTGVILIGFGTGIYLMGVNIVDLFPLSIILMYAIVFAIGWLTSFKSIGWVFAPVFMSMFAGGLNTGDVGKAADNFGAYSLVLLWCMLVSLLPLWKPLGKFRIEYNEQDEKLTMYAHKLSISSTLAYIISHLFEFTKLGWAPSAAGNVLRYETTETKKKVILRMIGIAVGLLLAMLAFFIAGDNMLLLLVFTTLSAVVTGLTLATNLRAFPFGYNMTIIILMGMAAGTEGLYASRFLYNLIGAFIAIAIAEYGFPKLHAHIKKTFENLD